MFLLTKKILPDVIGTINNTIIRKIVDILLKVLNTRRGKRF